MAVWFPNFTFCFKEAYARLVAVFKILHFTVKHKWPFGYNCKILYLTVKKPVENQTVIRFFTAKYEILLFYSNGNSFFLLQNTKFYSCTQAAIRVFTAKYKILKTVLKQPFVFSQQTKKFRIVPKLPFILWLQNTMFLKFFQISHLLFDNKLNKSKVVSKLPFVFWQWNKKFDVIRKRPFVFD